MRYEMPLSISRHRITRTGRRHHYRMIDKSLVNTTLNQTNSLQLDQNQGYQSNLPSPHPALAVLPPFGSMSSFGPTSSMAFGSTAVAAPRPYTSAVACLTIHFEVPIASSRSDSGGSRRYTSPSCSLTSKVMMEYSTRGHDEWTVVARALEPTHRNRYCSYPFWVAPMRQGWLCCPR